MKKTKNGNLGKALMMGTALVSLSAVEAQAITGTGAMSAIIVSPITVIEQTAMHFGEASIPAASTGDVVLPPDLAGAGVRSQTGAVTLLPGAGLESAGVMRITAVPGLNLDIALTATSFDVVDTAAVGPDMAVNAFMLRDGTAGAIAAPPIVAAVPGTATFLDVFVGATLNAGDGGTQTPGTYTGTYTMDVTYQ